MNHLEKLCRQYFEYQGYLVKGNVRVGKLSHGGWEGELDIVAYNPDTAHLIHIEASIDAHSWERREERFIKKFQSGRKYITSVVFPWLERDHKLEQLALFPSGARKELAGGRVMSIDEFVLEVKEFVRRIGIGAKNAIPEEFDLLRTIQFTENGYSRKLK